MKAMVMAAGLGTRLRPLTYEVPKPMVPVANRPVLEHILRLVRGHGFNEVIANLHWFPETIRGRFGDGSDLGLALSYSHEDELLGTAGGVRNVREFLTEGGDDSFLVMAGDALTDIDLAALARTHAEHGGVATMAVKKVPNVSEFGVVIVGDDGRVQGFQEKPDPAEALSDLANCMIYMLRPDVFDYFPDPPVIDFALDVFPALLEHDVPFHAHEIGDYWNDVGSVPEYLRGNLDALEGAAGRGTRSPHRRPRDRQGIGPAPWRRRARRRPRRRLDLRPARGSCRPRGQLVTLRRRLVRVPASSANLGPGFDVLAAALSLHLELEVSEAGEFAVDTGGEDVPADRANLCVRAFEQLQPAEGLRFEIRSDIPLARGLGSSAAAIVAGLMAADHMYELALERDELYAHAVELEGHPDNVAAALYGGFALCPRPDEAGDLPRPVRLEPPQGVEPLLVIPYEPVPTTEARAALPAEVPHGDAVANVAAATQLVLGIERSDLTLIERGLADRLHQPHRAELYPRSLALVAQAQDVGAIGASISGAGPTVLIWCFWQDTGKVAEALTKATRGWADVVRAPFSPLGADVAEL
jgi:homoserine kinase